MADNEKETSVKMALHVVCWRGFFHGNKKDVLTRSFQSDTRLKNWSGILFTFVRGSANSRRLFRKAKRPLPIGVPGNGRSLQMSPYSRQLDRVMTNIDVSFIKNQRLVESVSHRWRQLPYAEVCRTAGNRRPRLRLLSPRVHASRIRP